MFGPLATCYLFFGGVGAGALLVASLTDLRFVHEAFAPAATCSSLESADPLRRTLCFSFVAGFALTVLGALCLLFDVGRLDRAIALFLSPNLTYLSVGAYALGALGLLGGLLSAVRLFFVPHVARKAISVVEVACTVVSLVVMGYTGMLLSGMGTIALWDTPLVPVLFVLSSLSAGCAVVMCSAFAAASQENMPTRLLVLRLSRYDLVILFLEAVCAVAFAIGALGSYRAAASAEMLFTAGGLPTALWWVAFAGFGLVVPLALETAVRMRGVRQGWTVDVRAVCAVAGVLVLVGAFGLRTSIVEAGQHRSLELMPTETATEQQAGAVEAEAEGISAGMMAGMQDVETKEAKGSRG